MKVTIRDVANLAEVDKATVSRVLHGDPRISERTRVKVMESVRALDYRPDINARNLSMKSSRLIGIVMRDLGVPWLGGFLSGIERTLANSEYEMLVKSTDGIAARAKNALFRLNGRRAEGIIWCDAETFTDDIFIPVICFGFSSPAAYSVTTDDTASPTFETGAFAARMMLNIIAGKPLPGHEIRVVNTQD
ncbi:MAG: LacI family DNA-binding transcriptional regulator [Synergistes sp.]|nr:LacI family DNA-binding transcriptional regulator [Synergistes sp.]